jgi:hypothetical protein
MLAMEQNYHRRIMEGTWNPKQVKTDKEQIIALESTIAKLESDKATDASNAKDCESNLAWKKVAPRPGMPNTIKRKGKEYTWCPAHKMWAIHKPEEYQLLKQ